MSDSATLAAIEPRRRPGWVGQTLIILRKDIAIELATGEVVVTSGFFAVLIVVLASLAFYGGPGTQPPGCATPANGANGNVAASPWLSLAVAATPSTIVVGNTTPVIASLDDDGALPPPAGIDDFPDPSVAFAANYGSVAPSSDAIASGQAGTVYQSVAPGAASVTATLDAQTTPIAAIAAR